MQPVSMVLADGASALHLTDERFKTSRLTAVLMLPLREDTASAYALLPFLFRRGCAEYPDFRRFQRRLDLLYGAYVNADVVRLGEAQALILEIVSVNNGCTLNGEKITEQCAELLYKMIFEPALENGMFPEAAVEQEKRCLVETIESEVNEKRTYALQCCERLMCSGEPYAVNRYGTPEKVAQLTPETVTEAWKRCLNEAVFRFVIQSETDAAVRPFRDGLLRLDKRCPADCTGTVSPVPHDAVRRRIQHLPVNQSKLVIGCRTGIAEPDGDVPAARLMNMLLGGNPGSMLFRNVREKHSLCYYCTSSYDRLKGVLLIDSGVDAAKAAQAEEEIDRQTAALQRGEYADDDLESARRALVSRLLTYGDLQASLSSWYMGQSLLRQPQSPEQAAEEIMKVGRDRIAAAAKKLRKDSVYLLTSDGREE